MSEHDTYSNTAIYGGVATGLVAGASVGIMGEKKGFAGFLAMFIWLAMAVMFSLNAIDEFNTHKFSGFGSWLFLSFALAGWVFFFRNFLGFAKRIVVRVSSLFA